MSEVREYAIDALEESRDNHFRRMEGEHWDAFVGSIKEYGVVSPLIIRRRDGAPGRYEILAGHNRRDGAAEAGLKTVPCIEVTADDVDASVLIGITNRQREEVSDLEWGWAYRTALEAVKRTGADGTVKRKAAGGAGTFARESASTFADGAGLAEAGTVEPEAGANPSADGSGPVAVGASQRSIDIIARKFGVSRRTAQRKIRLTYLAPQLYELGEKLKLPQKMMIEFSYLPPVTQINLAQVIVIERIIPTQELARQLRAAAADKERTVAAGMERTAAAGMGRSVVADKERKAARGGQPEAYRQELAIDEVLQICLQYGKTESSPHGSGANGSKRYDISDDLFPEDLPMDKRQEYITAALSYVKENGIMDQRPKE